MKHHYVEFKDDLGANKSSKLFRGEGIAREYARAKVRDFGRPVTFCSSDGLGHVTRETIGAAAPTTSEAAAQKILRIGPWGYNMTLNNFYLVVRETPGTAIVRDIGSRTTRAAGYLAGYETPDIDAQNVNFKEYRISKKTKADGSIEYRGKAGLGWVSTLSVVEPGKDYYFNHCD